MTRKPHWKEERVCCDDESNKLKIYVSTMAINVETCRTGEWGLLKRSKEEKSFGSSLSDPVFSWKKANQHPHPKYCHSD